MPSTASTTGGRSSWARFWPSRRTGGFSARTLTVAGALGTLVSGRSRLVSVASGAALAAASALTRFGMVEAGIDSAKDPKYTVGPQKRRLEQRRQSGTVHDSIVTVH